jgi:nucleoid-associated protein EbfC
MPFDLSALMQQAQAMQEQMQKAQEKLAKKTVTGSSGGGMVVVTANGKGEMQKIQIDKQAVDPRDVAMLEDLILAAVNGALKAAQEAQAAEGPLSGLPNLDNLANLFPGGTGK